MSGIGNDADRLDVGSHTVSFGATGWRTEGRKSSYAVQNVSGETIGYGPRPLGPGGVGIGTVGDG